MLQWQRFCLDVGENWPTFSLRDSFKIWSLKGGKNSHIAKAGAECIDATAIWCERIKLDQGMPKVRSPKHYQNSNESCAYLFLGRLGHQGSTKIFAVLLMFKYSEKTTKIWWNLLNLFELTE